MACACWLVPTTILSGSSSSPAATSSLVRRGGPCRTTACAPCSRFERGRRSTTWRGFLAWFPRTRPRACSCQRAGTTPCTRGMPSRASRGAVIAPTQTRRSWSQPCPSALTTWGPTRCTAATTTASASSTLSGLGVSTRPSRLSSARTSRHLASEASSHAWSSTPTSRAWSPPAPTHATWRSTTRARASSCTTCRGSAAA
mmetsp:Transcript_11935/g.29223  ORF Transcript_11935/g.29223 Transcript_11935/m.29223 type:complete len:200 (-) Transcript_11935:748-1347(-)